MQVAKVGIVGLGRWAQVLARAAAKSMKLEIVSAYSRSEEKRQAFTREFGIAAVPDLAAMLADRTLDGVILTVPNEQHLPLAVEVANAGKHVYTEKPIASTLEEGLAIADLETRYGVTVTVGTGMVGVVCGAAGVVCGAGVSGVGGVVVGGVSTGGVCDDATPARQSTISAELLRSSKRLLRIDMTTPNPRRERTR